MNILDKGRLLQSATEAGFDTPATWSPKSAEEAGQIAHSVGGRFLVKPRSQLAQRTKTKACVASAPEVRAIFDLYVANANCDSEFAQACPEGLTPLLQQFYPEALNGIYSLSGFRDTAGRLIVRAARKVLQRPRQVGVGVCFEATPLNPALVDSTVRLCTHIGYYGVFELEFINSGLKSMLIDFNGRFYNQIGLDIARGMDLPRLAYAAALGSQDDAALMTDAIVKGDFDDFAFCNGLELSLMVNMQRLCRTMSAEEAKQWRCWTNGVTRKVVDASRDSTDPLPRIVDVAQHLAVAVRHPRSFLKQYGLMQ
jgi:predicted ATP-grasp superfamily ATP-dependent carboligase